METALVVVAHPDDETIWCGGTMLMHPEREWVVLSLCRALDKDREPKFRQACKTLNARCAISDLEDEHPEKKLASLEEVKQRMRAMLAGLKLGTSFDFIFTHGPNGEYGHNRHVEVHLAVKEMLQSKELSAKKVYFFSYKLADKGFYCVADSNSDEEGREGSKQAKRRGAGEEDARAQELSGKGNAHGRSAGGESRGDKTRGARDESEETREENMSGREGGRDARATTRLSAPIARAKHLLITSIYQFSRESFEAKSAKGAESFTAYKR